MSQITWRGYVGQYLVRSSPEGPDSAAWVITSFKLSCIESSPLLDRRWRHRLRAVCIRVQAAITQSSQALALLSGQPVIESQIWYSVLKFVHG